MMANLLLVQASIIGISVVLSALVFFPLGTINSNIGGQCLLFSKLYLSVIDPMLSTEVKIDLLNTEFGSDTDCDYTTFLSVTVTVVGLIFLWFLVHFGRGSEVDMSETGFLLSVFLFYFVLFICVIISSIKISSGFSYWCDNIKICAFNEEDASKCTKLDCVKFANITLADKDEDTSKFYSYFEMAEASSWLLMLILLIECLVTSQRIYQNFKSSFTWEQEPAKKLDDTPTPSPVGAINKGSDDYLENTFEDQLSESLESGKQSEAEVTVHKENVTSDGSYEMSVITETAAVENLPETKVKQRRRNKHEYSIQDGEPDNDKPEERSNKIKIKTRKTKDKDVKGNNQESATSVSKLNEQGKDNV